MEKTKTQTEHVLSLCREIFTQKLFDYGPAWRLMRPCSVTDQIFIKAKRIRSIETKGVAMIEEGIRSEFIAIVNYGVMGQLQLRLNATDKPDLTPQEALGMYDQCVEETVLLMYAKNHDYDEAWRSMRISSYTDLILMKIHRTKQIEDHDGVTLISEGIDANYKDIVNYAIFALIKLEYPNDSE